MCVYCNCYVFIQSVIIGSPADFEKWEFLVIYRPFLILQDNQWFQLCFEHSVLCILEIYGLYSP